MKGNVFLVIATSGTGKSTLINRIMNNFPDKFIKPISVTTRQPRVGEVDGVDYYFVDDIKFDEYVKKDLFIEYTEFNNNKYGTLISEFNRVLDSGQSVIKEIDGYGANKMKTIFKDYCFVIGLAADRETTICRMKQRGDSEIAILDRLDVFEPHNNDTFRFSDVIFNNYEMSKHGSIIDSIIGQKLHQ